MVGNYGHISREELRRAVYDIKFALQGGVHDGRGNNVEPMTATEALDELLRRLHTKPMTIPPLYVVHWDGCNEANGSHIHSHVSGRRYDIERALYVELLDNNKMYANTGGIRVPYIANSVLKDEKELKDVVGLYERQRGLIGS